MTFKFQFTATNLKVFVDGTLELDVDGVFPDGRFAFYNFSQPNVRYSAFTQIPFIAKEITSGPCASNPAEDCVSGFSSDSFTPAPGDNAFVAGVEGGGCTWEIASGTAAINSDGDLSVSWTGNLIDATVNPSPSGNNCSGVDNSTANRDFFVHVACSGAVIATTAIISPKPGNLVGDGDVDDEGVGLLTPAEVASCIDPTVLIMVEQGAQDQWTAFSTLDVDNSNIAIAIQIVQTQATDYDFTITYAPPESHPDNVIIFDTVPAEWDVSKIDGNPVPDTNPAPHKGPNQGEGVGLGCGESESDLGNDTNVDLERGGTIGKKCSSSTEIAWNLIPSVGLQTLLVDVTTRQSPSGKVKFKPTSCGKLTINDGAQAFEADGDGNLVLRLGGVPGGDIDPINGLPVPIGDPSNSLMLVAVDDLNGGGLVPDGSGDEDGDGLTDADEAFNVGTDPCVADTDGDGFLDGADVCPLIFGTATDSDNDGTLDTSEPNEAAICDPNVPVT